MYYYRKVRQLKTSILVAVSLWLCLSSLPALQTTDGAEAPTSTAATALSMQL